VKTLNVTFEKKKEDTQKQLNESQEDMGKNLEKTQTTIWTQRISTNSETKLRRL
jgi:hypothetical protein